MPWNILLPILPIQMFRKLSCASLAKNLVTLYQLNTLFPGRAQYWPPKLLYTVKFPRYNAKCTEENEIYYCTRNIPRRISLSSLHYISEKSISFGTVYTIVARRLVEFYKKQPTFLYDNHVWVDERRGTQTHSSPSP